MSERIDYTQWLKRGRNTFIPTDNAETVSKVDVGVYNLRVSQSVGFYLFKKDLSLDNLIKFNSSELIETMDGIQKFWDRKDKFEEYGYVHKRGILLYGAPGTGKTSLINLIIDKLINEQDGVVFILSTVDDLDLYERYIPEIFKIIEPDRKIITIIEDIDGFCGKGRSCETTLINILDGIEQSANILYLATTNYPELLPARLLNRPNRFDRRIEIGFPSKEVRREYFTTKLHKEDLEKINLNMWVDKTKNMSIAHLGELIKSVIILDNDFLETINILNGLKEIPNSVSLLKGNSDDKIGFKSGKTYEDVHSDDLDNEDVVGQPISAENSTKDLTVYPKNNVGLANRNHE